MENSRIDRQIKCFKNYKRNKELILKNSRNLPGNMLRKQFRPLFRLCLWIQQKANGFTVETLTDIKSPKGQPVIFAVTHIGKWDFEIVNETIREQFFVIAADFMHLHGAIGGFFMNLNGVIYVDEEDKDDKANTKRMMIKLLQSGRNIMIFPEGTWNLSENEIIRDIAYGIADVAISAGAVIVPIAIEQYDKHFVICQGRVLEPSKLQADKQRLTMALRDELAGLKWKIWEKNGICQRSSLANDYWDQFIQSRLMEWKQYSMREQVVNTYIPPNKREYWQVQRDLKTDKIPLWYQLLLEDLNNKVRNVGNENEYSCGKTTKNA